MDDLDVLPIPPENHENHYRVKLRDGSWSEWRHISVPITESDILAIERQSKMTKVEFNERFEK